MYTREQVLAFCASGVQSIEDPETPEYDLISVLDYAARYYPDLLPQLEACYSGDPGGGNGGGGSTLIYRLIHEVSPTRIDTGATYPGCSPTNTAACDPRQFGGLDLAIQWALDHGEVPYRVLSEAETWGIVSGAVAIDPARILSQEPAGGFQVSNTTLLLIGIGAALLLARRGQ